MIPVNPSYPNEKRQINVATSSGATLPLQNVATMPTAPISGGQAFPEPHDGDASGHTEDGEDVMTLPPAYGDFRGQPGVPPPPPEAERAPPRQRRAKERLG